MPQPQEYPIEAVLVGSSNNSSTERQPQEYKPDIIVTSEASDPTFKTIHFQYYTLIALIQTKYF